MGLLIGFAIIFVILAGRYAYGKSKDPNYRIADLFGITTLDPDATLPTMPPIPIESLLPDPTPAGSTAESAAPSTQETTEAPGTEVPSTSPEETTEPPATEPSTTEVPTTEVPTTEVPTTEVPTTEVPTTEAPTTEEETSEAPGSTEETAESTTAPTETETETETEIITDPTDIRFHLKRYNMDVSDLGSCKQLIVVQSSGTQCTMFFFEQTKKGWALAESIPSAPGVIGRNGVTTDKSEGDGCTPGGYYALGPCYGEDATSATAMEYHQITDGDYWVDDATSNYYNTLVHEDSFATRKGWLTGENMYELLRYYRYMVVIQYNTNPVIPGAGSAIFLHCQAGDTDTAGCVATTGATMFAIFRWLNPKSDPHILIY